MDDTTQTTLPFREGFQEQPAAQQSPRQQVNGQSQRPGPIIDVEPTPIETAPPPAPVETWPVKVKLLHRKIRNNNGQEISELVFREPTGGDINRCGNPCRINQDGDVVIDERKMSLIMANLSGVLSPLLDQMDPRDWNSAAYRLRSFFLPELAAW